MHSIHAIILAELSSPNTCLSSTPWLMAVSAVFQRSDFGQLHRLGDSVPGPLSMENARIRCMLFYGWENVNGCQ